MLGKSKVEFKGDHFLIDEETKVRIMSDKELSKLEKNNEFMKDHNYQILGYYVVENKQYVFVTFGTSGEIVTLPPKIVKNENKKT